MSEKAQTVLIGTTLKLAGDLLVASGIRLARSMGARVHLAHAYDVPLLYGGAPFVAEVPVDEIVDAERQARKDQLEVQMARLGLSPGEVQGTTLDVGAAHRVLLEAARKSDAALIVMGAAESHHTLERLFGSTADRVVRKADRPVLLVRDTLSVPPARVLLPVDLSQLSAEALRQGLGLLGRVPGARGATLEVLYVRTEVDGRPVHDAAAVTPEVRAGLARDLDRFLAGAASCEGWRIEPRIEFGFSDREVLGHIERTRPDLVVLGTHGRGGFERFLLGSVTSSVVQESQANVLVIPPEAARAGAAGTRPAVAAAA